MKRQRRKNLNLPEKANKILNGIVVVLILVVVKIWHLAVVQHDKKQEEAWRPQRRVVVERSDRATICDRYGIDMATNKVQYNATICYGPIRDLPRWTWRKNGEGKKSKFYFRKEYITDLSEKLAVELHLDAERIEDLIHSKAAILGNVPCVIKENISEEQYFRLKMLEKDWPGVLGEMTAKRCYPLGPVGGEVIGYIGPISRNEFDAITTEMRELRETIAAYEEGEKTAATVGCRSIEDVCLRLEELEKKAYHINDYVGKAGIEAGFDEELRGLRGKHIYLSDTKGNYLSELEGSETATSGNRLVLTLSSELQAYAEQLLAEYEGSIEKRDSIPENQPWMKGGAIVAMDPNTGEVYAMASFPRFDPNDFIRSGDPDELKAKNRLVNRWLETETYLAGIWEMREPYTRQRFNRLKKEYYEEKIELGWEEYLNFILPKKSPVAQILNNKNTLADAIEVQTAVQELVSLFESPELMITPAKVINFVYQGSEQVPLRVLLSLQEKEYLESCLESVFVQVTLLKEKLDPYFGLLRYNYEKLLLTDLYRLVVDGSCFTPVLHELLADMHLSKYREASARLVSVKMAVSSIVQELYKENDFKIWREQHFKEYLAEKREEEKRAQKKYARPYIEYLDQAHKELFETFWEQYGWDFLSLFLTGHCQVQDPKLAPYLETLQNWSCELAAGAHQGLEWTYHYQLLKEMIDEYDPHILIPFLKTLRSFATLDRPLLGVYSGLKGSKEKNLAIAFYPTYGFGFARSYAFRQATTVGSIFKLIPAYEALRQKYLNNRTAELNPLTIIDDKHRDWKAGGSWNVGYRLDGKPIPRYYRGGSLPRTEHAGVGKVDLMRALEVSSNPYFAMLAGDILDDPEDLCKAANLFGYGEKTGIGLPGEYAGRIPLDVAYNRTGLYAMSIGQHSLVGTPLQTAGMLATCANKGSVLKPQIVKEHFTGTEHIVQEPVARWRVFMPSEIQNLLLKGLKQVVMGEKGTARFVRSQFDPKLVSQVIGKTSTAEVIERMSLDAESGVLKLNHVGFGGISYTSDDYSQPELVVIVYLRYGEWGRDTAPLAMEIVKKWREIKARRS